MTSSTARDATAHIATSTGGAALTAQLDREWARLRRCPRSLRRARSWGTRLDDHAASQLRIDFTAIDDLGEIIDATHRRCGDAGEQLLRSLVTIAGEDQLAGRILVQRLLPGVLATTRRYRGLCDHDDPFGEAIGALWIAIAAFDVEHRRGPAAASIISDTMFAAFRRRVRLRSADEEPVQPHTLDDEPATPATSALVELADVVGEARRAGVPTFDIDLIRHLVQAGSPGLVARQRQVTPRTIRNHRDRAVEHIRHAVGVDAAA